MKAHATRGSIENHKGKRVPQDAEALAVEALAFLGAEPERLHRFLALSGVTVDRLRASAAVPGFLGAVLGYVTSDDDLLTTFAAETGRDPASIAKTHDLLAGPRDEFGS
jgi:hypothetical protein